MSALFVWRGKSLQSCPTLCDPMGHSPPGSSVHGILQAGNLGWVAIPGDLPDPGIELASPGAPALQTDSLPLSHFEVKCKWLSRVPLFATPWTIWPMELSRPEYWNG